MKTCPICKARCFDDMEICYGCMHPFEPEEDAATTPAAERGFDARRPSDSDAYPDAGFDGQSQKDANKAKPLRREPLCVFGAAGEEEPPWRDEQTDAAFDAEPYAERLAGSMPTSMPMLEPVEGPLAMASLGNGYRLVLAIERE
ncbi:MAG: hypothetical protein Q4C36_02470 [Coriobacteriia bacterium]|nr:hypothetical protein [Coriobacteriia bacterium]